MARYSDHLELIIRSNLGDVNEKIGALIHQKRGLKQGTRQVHLFGCEDLKILQVVDINGCGNNRINQRIGSLNPAFKEVVQ
jgi:hypothetical protein